MHSLFTLGRHHWALNDNTKSHFFDLSFFGNKAIIRALRGFDELSSISSSKIMAKMLQIN